MQETTKIKLEIVAGWLGYAILFALIVSLFTLMTQAQSSGPINTPLLNKSYYYVGTSPYLTIQSAVTSACASSPGGSVTIAAGVSPSDTIGAVTGGCTKAWIIDGRTVTDVCYVWTGSAYSSSGISCAQGAALPTDLVTLDTTQTITGTKSFTQTISGTNFSGSGTVSGTTIEGTTVQASTALESFFGTPATGSANVNSPPICGVGSFWTGSVAANDSWCWTNVLGSGSDPISTLTASHSGSSTGATVSIPFPLSSSSYSSTGNIATTANVTGGTSIGSPGGVFATATLPSFPTNANSAGISAQAGYHTSPTTGALDSYIWTNVIESGTNPSSSYVLSHTGATGGTSVAIPFLTFLGSLAANALANSTGLQSASGPGCTTGASPLASCIATLTFPVSYSDTNYVVSGCAIIGTSSDVALGNLLSPTTTTIQIKEFSLLAASSTGGTINCTVTHN